MITIPLGQGARPASIAGPYANRHGLICGATGTGKTYTLATMAEGFSAAGVPVFLCDVKGDLAGLALPGRGEAAPVQFFDVYGVQGAPMRATVRAVGADLLARVLELTPVQSDILGALFATYAGRLDSLNDLNRALRTPAKGFRATRASVDSIHRALIKFRGQGGDSFFGSPSFDLARLERHDESGAGVISILAADKLIQSPALYGAALLWLLGDLYKRAPEIGDVEAPRLVLIFDEAHLIFADASPHLVRRVEQTVRLIRSKGIGVYFASQSPLDIPRDVAAQLSNRVQHAMRSATLADRREIQGAADCLPHNPKIRATELIATMATGVALVSTLDASGRPTPVDVVRITAPRGRMGTLTADERAPFIRAAVTPQATRDTGGRRGDGTGYVAGLIVVALVVFACLAWPKVMIALACVAGVLAMIGLAKAR